MLWFIAALIFIAQNIVLFVTLHNLKKANKTVQDAVLLLSANAQVKPDDWSYFQTVIAYAKRLGGGRPDMPLFLNSAIPEGGDDQGDDSFIDGYRRIKKLAGQAYDVSIGALPTGATATKVDGVTVTSIR